MALAPLAHVLYSRVMQARPGRPEWPDRDRFVLSNGHASILQYSMLYLTGYGLELDDIEAFRQFESRTPGPPRGRATRPASRSPPGRSARASATPSAWRSPSASCATASAPTLVDHHTYVDRRRRLLHGGRQPRGGLARRPPRPRPADLRVRRQPHHDRRPDRAGLHRRRRRALRGLRLARRVPRRGRRRLRRARGGAARRPGRRGPPDAARSCARTSATPSPGPHRRPRGPRQPVHRRGRHPHQGGDGHPRRAVLVAARASSTAYRDACRRARRREPDASGTTRSTALDADERAAWDAAWAGTGIEGLGGRRCRRSSRARSSPPARRIAKVLGACFADVPRPASPAPPTSPATPAPSCPTTPASRRAEHPGGRQVYYGIREHAHGRGAGRHGHARRRPARRRHVLRLPRLHAPAGAPGRRCQRAKVVFVFSHDSVGVGEDGPTHQPVEHLATLRAIPGLQVIRPADANETVAAWRAAVDHDGPTALVLQPPGHPGVHRRLGRRARRRHRPRHRPARRRSCIVATGSEVAAGHRRRRAARRRRASPTRVVSLPSWDRFAAQGREYRDELLPPGVPVLSVEAATTFGWERYADDSHRHRPLRRQRPGRRGARQARASTSTTSCERARRS